MLYCKISWLNINCGSTWEVSGHFVPIAYLKLLTAVLHSRSLPFTDYWRKIFKRSVHKVLCSFSLVPRIFHSSPSIVFAIISRCSLWFFLCYFSYCSDSRWKLPSHGNPAGGKYLISNIFHRHQDRIKENQNNIVAKIRSRTAWYKE